MTAALGPNAGLVGRPDGRARLSSPALLLDLDAFERNLAAMAALGQRGGVALRPHVKAHKSVEVGRRQIAAGALGLACATLREAEVMAGAGLPGILLTSPVASAAMLTRLVALHRDKPDLAVVADDPTAVAALDAAVAGASAPLGVLVDLDVGQRRTGVGSVEAAVILAQTIAGAANLRFAGVQAYYGHLQQVTPYSDRRQKATEQQGRLRQVLTALAEAGLPATIVTGAGTGTAFIDTKSRLFTEIQPGSYLFLDSAYGAVELGLALERSLFVLAHIVSANRPGFAVVNAGFKAFATDSGKPVPVRGAPASTQYRFMGDEHGGLDFPPEHPLPIGAAVEFLTSHCDPTVNLYDQLHCVRGQRLEAIWPIEARGY